ncbi:MAG: S8 family peptidase [Candidatus Zixiibacteriota bacterium]|nr:MAG: S8 family peptidase [candidate division Zixibacteria bacterium]
MKRLSEHMSLMATVVAICLLLSVAVQAEPRFASAELVIKMAEGQSVDQVIADYGAYVVQELPQLEVHLVNTIAPGDLMALAAEIEALPEVQFCHPNFLIDPLNSVQSSLPFSDVAGTGSYEDQPAAQTLDLPTVHSIVTGGGVKIGVLDGGVDLDHPAFEGSVVSGYDYVDVDAVANDEPGGANSGHGTFVSGVIHLVAPSAQIVAYRVTDVDGEADGFVVAEAILQAIADGCKVINLSLVSTADHEAIAEAVDYAKQNNVIVVAAAGNEPLGEAHYPASDPNVLAVAAIDSVSLLADFSSFGDYIDVCAPGTEVYSPYRDEGYAWWGGTSFAAPFVSGQAALVFALVPTATWDQALNAIVGTAVNIDNINTGYAGQLGSGLIDVGASLTAAADNSCGDFDLNSSIDILDITRLLAYLYLDGDPSPNPSLGLIDGYLGITSNDFMTLWSYLFWTFTPPSCVLLHEGGYPVSEDTVRFMNLSVPPGYDTWDVDVWINASDSFGGVSLAFSYDCATSPLTIDSVQWHETKGSLVEFAVIDAESSTAVLAQTEMFPTVWDYIHFATVTFSLTPSDQEQLIDIALTDIPDDGATHTTVISRLDGGENPGAVVIGEVPVLAVSAGNLYCDPFGNTCLGIPRGNIDGSFDYEVDMGDLTALIDYLFISMEPLEAYGEADVAPLDGPDGVVDIADVTALIDHLFITYTPLPSCADAAPPAVPADPVGSIGTVFEDGRTTVWINSSTELRGLQIQLKGDEGTAITSALSDRMDLISGQTGDLVSVGIVDLDGDQTLLAGRTEVLTLDGEYEIVSAVASDISHHAAPLSVGLSPGDLSCGDFDEDGWIDISDIAQFLGYLYLDCDPSPNTSLELIDGYPGITNNDFMTLWSYLFWTFTPPSCELLHEGGYPTSEDTVRFMNLSVPPGNDTWDVEVWINASDDFGGISLAFSYDCATSPLTLDNIQWHNLGGEIREFAVVDAVSSTAVLSQNQVFPSVWDYIHFATLTFSLTSSSQEQLIDIALTDIPDDGATHTTVISRLDGGENPGAVVIGEVPVLAVSAGNLYCDPFGNTCLGVPRGNIDGSFDYEVDMGDLTALIDYLFISMEPLEAYGEADVAPLDGPDGVVDIADVTALIDHLFITYAPLPSCADAAPPARAMLPGSVGSLEARQVSGNTELTLTSDVELRGIMISLTGRGTADAASLAAPELDLLVGQRDDRLVVGLLDLDGSNSIPAGENQLVTIEGNYEVVSATASDADHRSLALAVKGAGETGLPDDYFLAQNYPNPFNPVATIAFGLPTASEVKLEVYNVLGRKVTTIIDGRLEAGYHSVQWDATSVASGLYFYRMTAGEFVEARKMLLLK